MSEATDRLWLGATTLALADNYLASYETLGDKIPMLAGVAKQLNVTQRVLKLWMADDTKEGWADFVERLHDAAERVSVNRGLSGEFSPKLAQIILAQHGITEKQEVKVSGSLQHTAIAMDMDPKEASRIYQEMLEAGD